MQLKMSVESFGHQLEQLTNLVQWLAGRFGGVQEVNSQLPANLCLPANPLDDLHHLEQEISSADTRSQVVCSFKCGISTQQA